MPPKAFGLTASHPVSTASPWPASPATVFLFAGSGLSIALAESTGLADPFTWASLLEEAAKPHGHVLVAPGYDGATALEAKIGRAALEDGLVQATRRRQEQIISRLRLARFDWPGLLQLLRPEAIFTTNWDMLLEHLYPLHRSLHWPGDRLEVVRCLREAEPFVCHLHGSVERGPLVVTLEDLARIESTFIDLPSIPTLWATRRMLVVGYSFPDPHVVSLLHAAQFLREDPTTCLVYFRAEDAQKFRDAWDTRALASTVQVIEYADHSDLYGEVRKLVVAANPALGTVSLSDVRSPAALHRQVSRLPYLYPYTSRLRDAVLESGRADQLLRWAGGLLIEVLDGGSDDAEAGILATLQSTVPDEWVPDVAVRKELIRRAEKLISGDPSRVGIIEPLAWSLGAAGAIEVYRHYLDQAILDPVWRLADMERIIRYYGESGLLIPAMGRHIMARRGRGALQANDVARTLFLLPLVDGPARRVVSGQLQASLRALQVSGEDSLAKAVRASMPGSSRGARGKSRRGRV